MNLIDLILQKTTDAETPKAFFYWSVLASLSAATKRNVWINKKIYKLYPNLYILLIAKSGLRKGAAISLARSIVEKLNNTRVIYGRSSIQGIIRELSEQKVFSSGYILNSAAGFVVSGELASSLVNDPQAQTILTDLYDSNYHAEWTSTLKGSGKEKLRDIYVTFLAATNPTLLDTFLEESSIQGGFIARTILIKAEKKAHINPLIDAEDDETISFDDEEVMKRFREISLAKGQFKFNPEAKELYKDWYRKFNEKLDNGGYNDATGTADRVHDQILKVAMLLSLADEVDLIIKMPHMTNAINDCTGAAVRIAEGLGISKGKSNLAVKTKIFLDELFARHDDGYSMSRDELLSRRYKDFDAYELDTMVATLTQGKIVEVARRGDSYHYKLSSRYIKEIGLMLRD